MKFLLTLLMAVSMYAQVLGTSVTTSDGPPTDWHSKRYSSPSSTVTIICYARPTLSTITQSGISNAVAAVFTVGGGHGLSLDSSPQVTITGGTGLWVGINGTFKATIINSTTFSVPVDTTTFSTVTGTVVVTTRAPRETYAMWSIKKIVLDSSGGPKGEYWASNGSSNLCVSPETAAFQ